MPMTQDLTNYANNMSVRSNKVASSHTDQHQKLKTSSKSSGYAPTTKVNSTSGRGISPQY